MHPPPHAQCQLQWQGRDVVHALSPQVPIDRILVEATLLMMIPLVPGVVSAVRHRSRTESVSVLSELDYL